MNKRLHFDYDVIGDILTIEGVAYPAEMFRHPSGATQAQIDAMASQPLEIGRPGEASFVIFRTEGSYDQAMWWRPNRAGYTYDINQAGRYTQAEAQRIETNSRGEDFGIPMSEIDEMTTAMTLPAWVAKQWRAEALANEPATPAFETRMRKGHAPRKAK